MVSEVISKSFRDPDGITIDDGQRILRLLRTSGVKKLNDLAKNPVADKFIADGKFIQTKIMQGDEVETILHEYGTNWAGVARHDRIPFVSYPHEWPAEMLHSAAKLTLELAEGFLNEGYCIKDASPRNIVFDGSRPVFVDVLSVEKRQPLDPIWHAEAQFIRNFILPLICWKKFGIPTGQLLFSAQDGITPDFVYNISKFTQRIFPPFLWWVSLPVWLSSSADGKFSRKSQSKLNARSPEMAKFILGRTFKRLKRILSNLEPRKSHTSHWQEYEKTWLYSNEQVADKKQAVLSALGAIPSGRILDIGCNAGSYSLEASGIGHQVVAFDADPDVAGLAWRRARQEHANISVFAANFACPTPATGWNNQEYRALLSRFENHFDGVIGLAIMHHLVVTSGIPLTMLFESLAKMTKNLLIWEYVDPADQNFRKIALGRDELYKWINPKTFEEITKPYFKIESKTEIISGQRILYVFSKNPTT